MDRISTAEDGLIPEVATRAGTNRNYGNFGEHFRNSWGTSHVQLGLLRLRTPGDPTSPSLVRTSARINGLTQV